MKRKYKFILAQIIVGSGILFFLAGAVGLGILLWNLPSIESLKRYRPAVTTEVYSKEYIKIGEFFDERRIFIPFEKIPPLLIRAFVSAEDASFFEHGGISPVAIARAAFKNLMAGYKKQGGSTITQQVARGILLSPKKDYTRKIREIALAMLMERYLSKEEILEIYLNQVYLGQSSYGVQAASQAYFGKDVQDLNLAEVAIIAGLTKAPSRDNPVKDFQAAKGRQAYVLERLVDDKFIQPEEKEAAIKTSIRIQKEYNLNHSVAPYFIEHIRQYVMNKYGADRILKEGLQIITTLEYKSALAANRALKKGIEEVDHRRGYRGIVKHLSEKEIEPFLIDLQNHKSTKDLVADAIFEAVVIKEKNDLLELDLGFVKHSIQLKDHWVKSEQVGVGDVVLLKFDGKSFDIYQEPQMQGSLLSIHPKTGELIAMVGGYDFTKSEFNRSIQGKRQPGSAFKPIIYTAALDNGYTPASIIVDAPIVYDDPTVEFEWKPQNYGGKFYGDTIFRECLILSRNIPTIKIVQHLGMDTIVDYAARMGIESSLDRNLSLALGSSTVSSLELATVYSTLANAGKKPQVTMIKQIMDRYGNVVEQAENANLPDLTIEEQISVWKSEQEKKATYALAMEKGKSGEDLPEGYSIAPQTAYIMTNLLKQVILSGTGQRASSLGRPAAGKTGTTNDNYDAWFSGYTPNLMAIVWLGFDEVQPLGVSEEGGKAATPIWLEFMQAALDGKPIEDFPTPEGIVFASIDPKTGKLANDKTPRPVLEAFKEGTEPVEVTNNSNRPNSATDFFLVE